jgi:hypothetical protein
VVSAVGPAGAAVGWSSARAAPAAAKASEATLAKHAIFLELIVDPLIAGLVVQRVLQFDRAGSMVAAKLSRSTRGPLANRRSRTLINVWAPWSGGATRMGAAERQGEGSRRVG